MKIDERMAAHYATFQTRNALRYLQDAYAAARSADCPQLARRIRSCFDSARGAIRHADRRNFDAAEGRPLRRRGIRRAA